ncbi:MAG: DOPA 4,5-dioxygenase family protein [Rhodospirillaceae bacterium]|nr:DOPA 4,5-dioxygenase family protein [Rhodospirillaceae bacterium]
MADTAQIRGYHAHVYYRDSAERDVAAKLRDDIEASFEVRLGRWREEPVGPHPLAMYQIAFAADQFSKIVPWLMLNRNGLTILVHPETGDDVIDHRDSPLWLGERLDLNIAFLEAGNTSA